ncbi:MAG TPA: polysaccharide ABC transporter ATP-binding protein [Pyrinomonadaceae bacterium]|nr:polysaccharide ABC transporter ATP-binding protein [Pyrinomonadaceae bacterium]
MQVIHAENLSKQYTLGSRQPNSIREMLTSVVKRASDSKHTIWALRDVSFKVADGETLGLIGHNGAGKSTLLKILSRITKPTAGTATIRGRVGSLLEVGTGFHSELSGRENIFMNGAILGMTRAEIKSKFDEIVAFSEIEEFLDTPVKHYSSGMYMRLAFSVAAHLDPEVLIVDEVLAVGDVNFQRKCLRKMREVGESGRTVIFVSHDMAAITRLCSRAIALVNGTIVSDGQSTDVVREYVANSWGMQSERDFTTEGKPPGSDDVRLLRTRMVDDSGATCGSFDISRPIGIEVTYEVRRPGSILLPNYQIYNTEGVHVFTIQDVSEWKRQTKEVGTYVTTGWIPGNLMSEGSFIVNCAVVTYLPNMVVHFNARDAVSFDVFDRMTGGTARGDFAGKMTGAVRPLVDFETSKIS